MLTFTFVAWYYKMWYECWGTTVNHELIIFGCFCWAVFIIRQKQYWPVFNDLGLGLSHLIRSWKSFESQSGRWSCPRCQVCWQLHCFSFFLHIFFFNLLHLSNWDIKLIHLKSLGWLFQYDRIQFTHIEPSFNSLTLYWKKTHWLLMAVILNWLGCVLWDAAQCPNWKTHFHSFQSAAAAAVRKWWLSAKQCISPMNLPLSSFSWLLFLYSEWILLQGQLLSQQMRWQPLYKSYNTQEMLSAMIMRTCPLPAALGWDLHSSAAPSYP